jgi:hypothetical protein
MTDQLKPMLDSPGQHQELSLQGGPASGTSITGEIITGALTLGGNSTVTMNLNAGQTVHVRQVALVK